MASSISPSIIANIPFHPSPSKRKRGASTSDPTAIHPFAPRLAIVTSQPLPPSQPRQQSLPDFHSHAPPPLYQSTHSSSTPHQPPPYVAACTPPSIIPADADICSSPRSAVAHQLQGLDLSTLPAAPHFGEEWTRHKRIRTDAMDLEAAASVDADEDARGRRASAPVLLSGHDDRGAASESTGGHPGASTTAATTRPRVSFAAGTEAHSSSDAALRPPPHARALQGKTFSRSPSPCMLDRSDDAEGDADSTSASQPPSLSGSPTLTPSTPFRRSRRPLQIHSPDRTCSPRPASKGPLHTTRNHAAIARKASPSPHAVHLRRTLTWSDAEITGHLLLDPEDDGTGLNGIGFKPTPAVAWARSQRRKKQLAEWKAREAREARAKRSEKRRSGGGLGAFAGLAGGGVGGGGTLAGAGVAKRGVRFA
jgi:hypothetical protein